MFETDFPHPTCIYPDGLDYADAALGDLDDDEVAAIMGLNAARLYDIALPV
jgi:predicted TIM-barrel fold metal-dependent hydrolase